MLPEAETTVNYMKKSQVIVLLVGSLFAISPVAGCAWNNGSPQTKERVEIRYANVEQAKAAILSGTGSGIGKEGSLQRSLSDVISLKIAGDDVVVIPYTSSDPASGVHRSVKHACFFRKDLETGELVYVMSMTFGNTDAKIWELPLSKEVEERYTQMREQ